MPLRWTMTLIRNCDDVISSLNVCWVYNATMSYHQFQIFEKVGTEESQIDNSIELSERVNLLIKQNTYFLSYSPNDFIFSCTKLSLALLYFGMPNTKYNVMTILKKLISECIQ